MASATAQRSGAAARSRLLAAVLGLGMSAALAAPARASLLRHGSHKASGTIASFDPVTRWLVLSTSRGRLGFCADDAQAWIGSRSVDLLDLAKVAGQPATVGYVESGAERHATAVHVKPPAKARPR
jgi:hypothetical protein